MTACAKTIASLILIASFSACTTNYFEVPVETPLEPKIDVSRFQRVLIAGFVTAGSKEIDTNLETARMLKSQLRNNSNLQVIDAEVFQMKIVAERQGTVSRATEEQQEPISTENIEDGLTEDKVSSEENEQDLEAYEHIFANVNYWKQLGEEYQSPLIVTGTIYFAPHQRSGMVNREREIYDSFGRRQVIPLRTYQDRKGYVLSPKFVFIDGNTGATLYTQRNREEILYDAAQNRPALSSYFELMDRLLPSFVGTLSNESIQGVRILLK